MAGVSVTLIYTWVLFSSVILISAHESNCRVDEYNVQADFDPAKFSGRWYGYSYLPNPVFPRDLTFQDFSLTFLPRDDGNYSAYRTARLANSRFECITTEGVLLMTNVNSNISAKMELQGDINDPALTPFWVMETDYMWYALIYWCAGPLNQTTGYCEKDDVNSWALVRDIYSPLPDMQAKRVTERQEYFCTNASLYERFLHGAHQCQILSPMFWIPQAGFDLTRYMGRWYEQLFVPSAPIPPQESYSDYQHNYDLKDDGTISLRISGRDPTNPGVCFNNTRRTVEKTETPGKWVYRVADDKVYDYVVVRTDYDSYAFVLGCITVSQDGTHCTRFRNWVWTRSRYMTGGQALLTALLTDLYGLAPREFLTSAQDNSCTWEPQPPAPKECKDTSKGAVHDSGKILMFVLVSVVTFLGIF